ncbi:uncharacterized protein LOC109807029 [Cajanus cajan]|uniref:Uncharacterized protein n=1 Tax=Cajanus cajan TaxID=3821 RepID=A0A151SSW2_CAJCA|nr:uncharacterized protein LOC109807029 [Cajanus cajan]KYP57866.1 hypothetical protein KK1_004147 [Cajanus cajan]
MFMFAFIFVQITNKCLNASLTSISEARVASSPISEISYANHSEDDNISLLDEAFPETFLSYDMMPSKKITEEEGSDSTKCLDAYELDGVIFSSMESEIVATNLRNAKPKFFNSHDSAPQYKKLVDEITKYVIEDLYKNTVAEDLDRSYQVLTAKNRIVSLCFFIWLIGVLTIFFFTSDIHCPYSGPLPT